MTNILIVCTANICRSPMAEVILKRLVSRLPDADQWQVQSAGTWARFGDPAAELSQLVVLEMGMDLSRHHSQPVTPELIRSSDLILTMERQQKEGLILLNRSLARRIFMLSEMVGRVEDVPDPIGGELADYQAAARLMEYYLSTGLSKIHQLAVKLDSETVD